jgi:hypothetical protein
MVKNKDYNLRLGNKNKLYNHILGKDNSDQLVWVLEVVFGR